MLSPDMATKWQQGAAGRGGASPARCVHPGAARRLQRPGPPGPCDLGLGAERGVRQGSVVLMTLASETWPPGNQAANLSSPESCSHLGVLWDPELCGGKTLDVGTSEGAEVGQTDRETKTHRETWGNAERDPFTCPSIHPSIQYSPQALTAKQALCWLVLRTQRWPGQPGPAPMGHPGQGHIDK